MSEQRCRKRSLTTVSEPKPQAAVGMNSGLHRDCRWFLLNLFSVLYQEIFFVHKEMLWSNMHQPNDIATAAQ